MSAAYQHHPANRCYNTPMKKASLILSHLRNQPQFKVLKQHECYQKYISLLGKKWQKAIAFVYVKNETLFVAVTHPGFKMELNYNRDLLKSVLTQLASHEKACSGLKARKVAIFHSKYRSAVRTDTTIDTIPYYHELSSAAFSIETKDEEIRKEFESIREKIKENLSAAERQ